MQRSAPQRMAGPADPRPAGVDQTLTRLRRTIAPHRAGWGSRERLRTLRTAVAAALVATMLFVPARSHGVDPGIPYPSASEASDDKLGSVLIYNVISSSTLSPSARNTEISITNHHDTQSTTVRLFYIEGQTGVARRSPPIVLAPGQVVSLLASVVAPLLEGYAIALAVDGVNGCPISFNHLSGSAAVKLSSGHRADLGAEAIAALYTGAIAGCTDISSTATLAFDGAQYNRMAATVAIDNFGAAADGDAGLLVLNRISGDLTTAIGSLGFAYEGAASGGDSFSGGVINSGTPQQRQSTENFLAVPAGETGWLSINAGVGVAGAFLNFNSNAASAAGAFTAGHNLHRLALANHSLVVPVLSATPGFPYPASSEASDNRAGSVLVFPFASVSTTSPNSETALLTLTNTHGAMVDVQLFFVRGMTGAINPLATMLLTLPPHAPRSVPASAFPSGFRGYVIAVAVDGSSGCPIAFNHLIGDVDVKLGSGHFASLPATAVAALYDGAVSGCTTGDAVLRFDGLDYNRLPRGLALDSAGSGADGNFTLFVLDRIGGALDAALGPIGMVNGSFYDETGSPSAFDFNAPPQFLGSFDPGIPAGLTTWFEAYPALGVAMVGSTLSFNANAASVASAFSGGHNLHVLTLATDTLTLGDAPINTPTRTATGTATNPAATATRTRTPIGPLPTATRTATATSPAPTSTRTRTPTGPLPTATRTQFGTATATALRTATPTVGASATATAAELGATPTFTPMDPSPTGSLPPSPTATPPPSSCVGDCNGDGVVSVNELIIGVNILLESQPISACPAFDRNSTGTVTIDELIQGVSNLLGACPM